jgi:prepilin-type N-terminal cleavage/methylation domain-containing protein
MLPMKRCQCAGGFTLVEALVALTVLGVAVASALVPICAAVDQKDRAMKQTVATMLAEQIIQECKAQTRWSYEEWAELGPSGGETWRTSYDEQSDYSGFSETAGQFGAVFGPHLTATEFPRNLRRTCHLQYVWLTGEQTVYAPDFLLLTVRVYEGDQELITVSRLIHNVNHAYP